ncbi:DinB family protein [Spirosoma sp. KCTC 42546]|uniref:DinB family protein n=1 Tax=Spirosoma sp. KCTC 42546 TaxID=2520506 RepID=UPI00115AC060|nr:DinB family protein [Spirosoma sp. KCTC 42546]QDK82509.1 DinB family protein [Spirosoma sp. KCTC 42546]
MTTELLSQLWQMSQAASQGPIRKLTADNYRNRLTPETASAGFIALHTAESMHRMASLLFGHEISIPLQATGGVSDEGKPLDLASIQQLVSDSFAMVAHHIQQTSDDQWAEIIPSPFGEVPRMQVLSFLMHHNSYHAGQIAQAIKKGKEFSLVI